MPNWWPFNSEQVKQESYEVAGSIPIGVSSGFFQSQDIDSEQFAAESYNANAIVYACIRELSVAVSEPFYRVLVPTSSEPAAAPPGNPIQALIDHPNQSQDFYELLEDVITDLYISGNVFLYKVRNGAGKIVELRVMRPDRMTIKSDPTYGIEAYQYEINGDRYEVSPRDMAHLKFSNYTSDLYGLSPLQPIASVINLDMAQIQYGKNAFQNSGVVGGILKLSNSRIQTEEQANLIRSRWRSTFGGANQHRLAILDSDATYEKIGSSMEELAFPSLRDTTEARICMAFGVPPIIIGSVVGLDRATYSNYREARQSFFTETMIPLCERIVRFLNKCLGYEFPNAGYVDADFTRVAALMEDQSKLSDRLISQWNAGLISLNEARAGLSLDSLAGGDLRRLPMSVSELPTDLVVPTFLSPPADSPTLALAPGETKKLESQLDPDSVYDPLPGQPSKRKLNQDLIAARISQVDDLTPRLEKYYRSLKNRVDGVLGRYMQSGIDEAKNYPFNAANLLPPEARDDLAGILRAAYAKIARETFDIMDDGAGLGILGFDEKQTYIQNILGRAQVSAIEIHNTTQKAINKVVEHGLANGYSVAQVADGVPGEMAGIRNVVMETYKNRALTIARTETARAQNLSSVVWATEQGSNYMEAFDPDGDANDTFTDNNDPYGRTCAERHLQVYRAEDALDIVDHPNGTLCWTPLPSTYQPEQSLGQPIQEVKEAISARI